MPADYLMILDYGITSYSYYFFLITEEDNEDNTWEEEDDDDDDDGKKKKNERYLFPVVWPYDTHAASEALSISITGPHTQTARNGASKFKGIVIITNRQRDKTKRSVFALVQI